MTSESDDGRVTHEEALRRVRGMVVGRAESDEPRLRAYIARQAELEAGWEQSLNDMNEACLETGRERDAATARAAEAERLLRDVVEARGAAYHSWQCICDVCVALEQALNAGAAHLQSLKAKEPTDG